MMMMADRMMDRFGQLTLWEAASSPRTQAFLLVGTLFLLPVILTYSGWSYWVFRGKVRATRDIHE